MSREAAIDSIDADGDRDADADDREEGVLPGIGGLGQRPGQGRGLCGDDDDEEVTVISASFRARAKSVGTDGSLSPTRSRYSTSQGRHYYTIVITHADITHLLLHDFYHILN